MDFNFDRLKEFYRSYITHTDRPSEEQESFQCYVKDVFLSILQILLTALILLVIASWPVEYFLVENSEVFFWFSMWRVIVFPVVLTFIIGIRYFERIRFHANEIMLVGLVFCFAWIGYCVGRAGRVVPDQNPWFYLAYVIPFFITPMALRIEKRVFATAIVPIAFLSGYFLARPSFLNRPYLFSSLIIILGTSVISLGLGHIIYHLNRINFFKEKKLKQLATHDQLTGLANRREIENRLKENLEQSDRYDFPVSLIMMDLDHFKEINDTHGHSAGDEVLRTTGEILHEETRDTDLAGRYGGEEFAIVSPHTHLKDATQLAERIRKSLKSKTFESEDGTFSVTCSIGVAEYFERSESKDDFVKRADDALYRAKNSGRDQIQKN